MAYQHKTDMELASGSGFISEFNRNILDLPDDCLIAILRILSLKNLYFVALTCTRLNAIAHTVFKLKPDNKVLDIRQYLTDGNQNGTPITNIHGLVQFLMHFGYYIHEII